MTDLDRLREELAPDLEPVRTIGRGSVAEVVLAREPALRRLVAIKLLRADLAGDEVARRRFEREAKAAASISHPNVTAIHRVSHLTDGRPLIVLEFVDGRTLADLLAARGPLPHEEVARILLAVAGALNAAHHRDVVHRDVRPGNVMVEAETERVVLMDFGIAALLETGGEHVTRLTRPDARLGDPQHMSPEQLRGEPVTPETDVWALGVLGYELLAGRGPFGGSTLAEQLDAVLKRDPTPLSTLVPDVDHRVADLLMRCLKRDPGQRPRAGEAFEELERLATNAHAVAPPAHPPAHHALPGVGPAFLSDFLGELRRRKVYRVAVAYVAGAFLLLEGADLVSPVFTGGNPDFWYRILATLVLAGFPVALVLSWAFDITPDAALDPAAPVTWKRRILPVAGLALSVAAAVAVWVLLIG